MEEHSTPKTDPDWEEKIIKDALIHSTDNLPVSTENLTTKVLNKIHEEAES